MQENLLLQYELVTKNKYKLVTEDCIAIDPKKN